MTERPQFHPDPTIDAVLPQWSTTPTYMEVHTARRLFDTWDDLEGFFSGIAPRSSVGASGVMHKGGWRTGIDPGHVLRVLEELSVQRDELPQAAFLVKNNPKFRSARSRYDMSEHRRKQARTFIDMFAGTSLPDLFVALAYLPRDDQNSARWVRECLDSGMPPKYIRGLHHLASRPAEWPPLKLGELYRAGVPAAYPAFFWNRPAEFWKLYESGVPFEYAKALYGI